MFSLITRLLDGIPRLLFKIWKFTIPYIKTSFILIYYLHCHWCDLKDYVFGKDIKYLVETDETKSYLLVSKFVLRQKFFDVFFGTKFFRLDLFEVQLSIYQLKNAIIGITKPDVIVLPRFVIRVRNYKYSPYIFFYEDIKLNNTLSFFKKHIYLGFKSLWRAWRLWIISLTLSISALLFLSFLRVLPVNTVLFQWFALAMFAYWLLSGFVFFIKKYQYSRFTSSIQRFWRRSYILFWLIESCLLVVFLYLTLNSSQETIYMLDQIQVFKTHLFSWKLFLPKLFIVTFLVIFSYLLLLNIKWNVFNKNLFFIVLITILLLYLLWIEFYQIYHVSNFYANLFWSYDIDERLWSLESDVRRTRIVNHYVMILFILKFWHIVFIVGFWIFFVLRSNELSRTRYPLYSANFQNFIILYIMTWLFMYPWFKFTFHKFLETPYYWFFFSTHKLGLRVFIYDIKLLIFGLLDYFKHTKQLYSFINTDFFYWLASNEQINYYGFRKHTLRNYIITNSLN